MILTSDSVVTVPSGPTSFARHVLLFRPVNRRKVDGERGFRGRVLPQRHLREGEHATRCAHRRRVGVLVRHVDDFLNAALNNDLGTLVAGKQSNVDL